MGLLRWNHLFYISWQIIYILFKKKKKEKKKVRLNSKTQISTDVVFNAVFVLFSSISIPLSHTDIVAAFVIWIPKIAFLLALSIFA